MVMMVAELQVTLFCAAAVAYIALSGFPKAGVKVSFLYPGTLLTDTLFLLPFKCHVNIYCGHLSGMIMFVRGAATLLLGTKLYHNHNLMGIYLRILFNISWASLEWVHLPSLGSLV